MLWSPSICGLGPFFYCPYSPECVEEEFSEVRILGILGSPPTNNTLATSKQH